MTASLVRVGARAASLASPADSPSLEQTVVGRLVVGAINGALGDALDRRSNPLTLRMTVRRDGRDVELTGDGLAAAFPDATPRLALFAHGLCQNDDAWKLGAARHVPYGVRLQAELGYTPLYLRYNTGRHISENGRELAGLLEKVTCAWPVEVHEIALIRASAWGEARRGERMRFPVDHYRDVAAANHFDLLNHSAVYQQICRWLSGRQVLAERSGDPTGMAHRP